MTLKPVPQALTSWESKEISMDVVPDKIPNGSNVYIGSCSSTPEAVLGALVDNWKSTDIQILQMIPGGDLPHMRENIDRFRTSSFFSLSKTMYMGLESLNTSKKMEGLADYRPMSYSSVPRLLEENIMSVDVAVIKVTPPHKGFVSLGCGVEHSMSFIQHAKVVVAEVNIHMPWTEGHSKLRIEQIDWWVRHDQPLKTTDELWPVLLKDHAMNRYPQHVIDSIGENLIKLIPDGATLKFGWSPLSYIVLPYLHRRRNLGLHTDVLLEGMFRLHESGVIDNSLKSIDTGRTVVSQAHGSADLYAYLDRNPAIEFRSSDYVNDPQILGKIDNLIAIEGALKIDMTGQVSTDSIAHKFYGGVASTSESVRGAHFSKGGFPIVVLPSKSLQGRSNLLFALPPGSGVTITRSDVEFVVTEHGIAYLYGKSIRERCLALIEIAHPDFRNELLEEAKRNKYISLSQPGYSFQSKYPAEFECMHTTKKGKKVFVRPIKITDEDILRSFFHKLSDHSVYLRYFRKMQSMPQRILQQFTDLNYSSDMALVVLYPPPNHGGSFASELVAIGQWITDPRDIHSPPEMAFQVRDDWQGEGLGKYLFLRLLELSKYFYEHVQFKADVLVDNKPMRHVFEHSPVPYRQRSEFGVVTYTFDLLEKKCLESSK